MTGFAVALGSNQGDRVGHLRTAVAAMAGLGSVEAVSSLYETEPLGGPEQDPYLNAVALLDTPLSPEELLGRLQDIESEHSRTREVRWGPRTLDLDIVAMEGGPVDSPELQVPHPRAAQRRFVLEPLAEVWPDAHVGPDLTAGRALGSVQEQEVDRLVSEWLGGIRPSWPWVVTQLLWFGAVGVALVYQGSLPTRFGILSGLGGMLALVGLALIAAGARSLGPALTILPEPRPGAALVEEGVYSLARHPIYGGLVLLMLGISLLLRSLLGAVLSVGLLFFFLAKSAHEERFLRIAYPGYRAYRRQVPKWLIPFLV